MRKKALLFFSVLGILFSILPSPIWAQQSKRVLVLCSYHQGDQWTDGIIQGVRSVLTEGNAEVYFEYLEARRHKEADWLKKFGSVMSHKYREYPPQLIISADDPALDFLLNNRSRLFSGVPLVFCGINDFQPKRLGGHQNITGVNETLDIAETIKIALQLHPTARHLLAVISDTQAHWRATAEAFRRVIPEFSKRVKITEIKNLKMADAPSVLKTISADSVVLSLADLLDEGGRDVERKKSWRFLSEHSAAPVYTLWAPALETGVVGGKVVSGFHQGETAARLASRILAGDSVSTVPIVLQSPNVPMFDWKALQRFGVREMDLPPDSQILNKPFSFYERYRMWIWIGLALFMIQTWLLLGLIINRARRIKGEKALRESEERYRGLYDDAPIAYHEYNQEGRIVSVNKRELEMLGYNVDEMVGKYVWDFVVEKDKAEKSVKGRISGLVPPAKGLERLFRRKDGTTFPVLIDEVIIKNEAGRIIGVRSSILDITERKQAEEKLQRSERQLSNAVNLAQLGHWELDIASGMFTFSDSFYAIFHTTAEEMGGYHMSIADYANRFVHPDDMWQVAEETRQAMETDDPGFSRYIEHRILYADGGVGDIAVRFFIVKDSQGKTIKTFGVNQDITERKRAEEQIRTSLKEKEVLLKEIHHRVRNNLTTIASIFSLQSPYLEDKKSKEIFRECENRVRTMSKIHTKLYQSKDLAHIDFGSYLGELSNELFLSYQIDPEAVEFDIQVEDISLDIHNALPLGLLLTELITNSLKYAFPEGRKGILQVNLRRDNDRMVLSVADDGIGFPEDIDYQKTSTLGLQLVTGLVKQLKGSLELKKGRGTVWIITFPLAR